MLYKVFFTYCLNYGTNGFPFSNIKKQHSIMLQANLINSLPLGLDLRITFGIDKGNMYGKNGGIMVSLVKMGVL